MVYKNGMIWFLAQMSQDVQVFYPTYKSYQYLMFSKFYKAISIFIIFLLELLLSLVFLLSWKDLNIVKGKDIYIAIDNKH